MSFPRPDELSSQAEISRNMKRDKNIKKAVLGTGLALSSKIMPFLSEFIDPSLALKGISKISPNLGNFLKNGIKSGLSLESGIDYIKKNISNEESSVKDSRNIVQKYSDQLHQFLDSEIKKGRNPTQAGALAQLNDRFKGVIRKMEEDYQTPFSSILEQSYGMKKQSSETQGIQQPQGMSPAMERLSGLLQEGIKRFGG